jgi:uncharacterized membrane protein YhaH (DUF805 family)
MNFQDAIKTCFTKYADFSGRASRSEYWWFVLFIIIVSLATSFISTTLSALFTLATIVPSLAAAARRLHDSDRSGWMQLIALVPVVGWIIVIYFLAQEPKEPNRFGATAPAAPSEPVVG